MDYYPNSIKIEVPEDLVYDVNNWLASKYQHYDDIKWRVDGYKLYLKLKERDKFGRLVYPSEYPAEYIPVSKKLVEAYLKFQTNPNYWTLKYSKDELLICNKGTIYIYDLNKNEVKGTLGFPSAMIRCGLETWQDYYEHVSKPKDYLKLNREYDEMHFVELLLESGYGNDGHPIEPNEDIYLEDEDNNDNDYEEED